MNNSILNTIELISYTAIKIAEAGRVLGSYDYSESESLFFLMRELGCTIDSLAIKKDENEKLLRLCKSFEYVDQFCEISSIENYGDDPRNLSEAVLLCVPHINSVFDALHGLKKIRSATGHLDNEERLSFVMMLCEAFEAFDILGNEAVLGAFDMIDHKSKEMFVSEKQTSIQC